MNQGTDPARNGSFCSSAVPPAASLQAAAMPETASKMLDALSAIYQREMAQYQLPSQRSVNLATVPTMVKSMLSPEAAGLVLTSDQSHLVLASLADAVRVEPGHTDRGATASSATLEAAVRCTAQLIESFRPTAA